MATLTGTRVKDTYKDLLQVSNSNSGIDGTLRTVSDGEATNSVLQLSSTAVNISSAGALQYGGTAITSTAAELNILDGATITVSELNILDGVTATASELNILDGVTATASELNILDGVTATASELNILDGVTSTAAELNVLDGYTGSVTELNYLDTLHATGVTSTEFDYLDGVTSNIQTQLDSKISATLTQEQVEDFVGGMLDGTETGISVSYDDTDGNIDFVVASQTDENFTTADHSKLDGIEASADVTDATNVTAAGALMDSEVSNLAFVKGLTKGISDGNVLTANDAVADNDFLRIDGTEVEGRTAAQVRSDLNVEDGATADQTNAEIRTAVEAASDSNVFTDDDHSKLNAIEASADVTDTANVTSAGALMDSELTSIADVKALDQSVVSGATPTFTTTNFTDASNKRFMTDAQETKLDSVESNATADQTNEEIQDIVGGMLTGNTETGITVTYQDGDGTIDFVVGTLNQDTTGSAATLTTARNIGGVSFDGSANIDLPGVNSSGNQNTSGTAANATLAATVTVSDSTANTNFPVVFHDESNALLDDTGALRYNPSSGTLLVPNLSVAGTTTTVDTVTMEASNAIIFEGATADSNETTLSIIDPTGDRTINLPNVSGTIPVLASASTTQITSTPEELNILDGVTATATELNYVDGVTSSIQTQLDAKIEATLTTEQVQDIVGAMFTSNTETRISASYQDGDGTIDLVVDDMTADTNTQLSSEQVQDIVGAMVSSNTETGISVTYEDGDGTLDFVVATLNQDTTGNAATATALETARTIHGVSFDGTANIDLSEVVQDTAGGMFTGNTETFITATYQDADGTVDLVVPVLDEDDLSSDSASHLVTQQSVKAYIDAQVAASGSGDITAVTFQTDSGSGSKASDTGGSADFSLLGGDGIGITNSGTTITAAVSAAQTTITSLLATDIKIGEDDQTKIDFETADTINFYAGNEKQLILTDGALTPGADNILDLGSSSVEFKDAFFDGTVTSDAFAGPLTGDVTGNADTATALATARNIHGVSFDGTGNIDLTEVIEDTVGAMVSSNTESGITVAYQDGDGTLDFTVGTLNQDTTGNAATATALETARNIHGVSFDGTGNIDLSEVIQDTVGAMFSSNTETRITATYQDSDGTIDLVVDDLDTDTQLSTENVQDIVGAMFSSNTETRISATYQDGDGTIDLAVDDMTANDNTNQLTTFQLEDGDGTEVTVAHAKEVKFVEGGRIDINWTDTSTGSDGDPYDLTFTVDDDLSNYDNSSSGFLTAHPNISAASSSDNSGRTYIQDISVDSNGHVTGIATATETVTNSDTNTNQLTTFQLEDGDGTEVTIAHGKEVKFVEGGGIDINWTDTSNGSDGDPFDLTFTVSSQTDNNFTDSDHSKLDGIEASADVTDTSNVTSAGALMDSECTNLSAVKGINQALTTSSDVQFGDVTLGGIVLDGNTISGIDDSGEFTNNDSHIMTSAAVEDKILGYGYTTNTGDITAVTVTAGDGLTGGGTASSGAFSKTVHVGAGTGIAVNSNDVALSHLGIESLSDPGADRLLIWDDSAGAVVFATPNSNLAISGTNVNATDTNTNTTYSAGTNISLSGTTFNVDDAFLKNDANDTTSGTITAAGFNTASGKVGDVDDEYIDFGTAGEIQFKIDNVEDFMMADGGTFHANADIIAYSSSISSDKKLKKNIKDVRYGLEDVLKLRGVEFDWKEKLDGKHDIGFIAQEVQEVVPELVKEVDGLNDEEAHLVVDYAKLVPVLVESIKELKAEIEELKK